MWGTFSQTEGSKISDLFVFFPRKKKKEREREKRKSTTNKPDNSSYFKTKTV